MTDSDCTAFLQWALPQLDLRWAGFRKVRRQVCKRVKQRVQDLGLQDLAAYKMRLDSDPLEWRFLDECCHITISRFFRDKGVFEALRERVLPRLAARARCEGRSVQIWSAGCASGEEPYTLKIVWDLELANTHSDISICIVATDIDRAMLARARNACFEPTSLHELPPHLVAGAFDHIGPQYRLKARHQEGIEFLLQDVRLQAPTQLFDMILCRYLAFTYFAMPLQECVLARILDHLLPNGYLVIGTHERLPAGGEALVPVMGAPQIFEKRSQFQ